MSLKKTNKTEELQVSFLPDRKAAVEEIPWRKRGILIVCGIVVIIFGGGVYFRVRASMSIKTARAMETALTELRAKLMQEEQTVEDTLAIGRTIGFAKSALAAHTTGAGVLTLLEASTVPEVVISQLAVDAKGTIVLSARGKDYTAVVRQFLAWNAEPAITNIQVSGVSAKLDQLGNIAAVEFNATLTLGSDLFKFTPTAYAQ